MFYTIEICTKYKPGYDKSAYLIRVLFNFNVLLYSLLEYILALEFHVLNEVL